jgi:hypothetical protein
MPGPLPPKHMAGDMRSMGEWFNAPVEEQGIARKLLHGLLDLPHDVYAGKKTELEPGENLMFAANMVSPQALAPVKGGLGIFGGVKAKTANHNMREMAEAMEKAGSPSDTIWAATGWGRGKDGKPRFEIDDSKAHLRHSAKDQLEATGEIPAIGKGFSRFDHKELYEAYPDLADIPVHQLSEDQSFLGTYQPWNDKIGLKQGFRPDMQSTLLHELQHAVQGIEGFAPGGNPGMFKDIYDHAKVGRIGDALHLTYARINAISKRAQEGQSLTAKESEEWRVLHDVYDGLTTLQRRVKGRGITPNDQYKALAGETEARNVQHRERWDAQKRSDVPPEFSEDVPRKKQTVRY